MRRLLLPIISIALLAFGACSATPVAPVEPAASPTSGPTSTPTAGPTARPSPSARGTATPAASKKPDDASVEEQGDDNAGSSMTAFDHAYHYKDGVEVEVTTIRHGTVTAKDVAAGARQKKGSPWVQLSLRVKNGSKHQMTELVGDFEFSYGPHKDPADPIGLPGQHDKSLSGSIAPGKAKVISSTFSVPVQDQDDVVLGFTPDIDHHTAYFSGSIA